LNESILRHGDSEAALSEDLMRAKNELLEARSFYQKYEVQVVSLLSTASAKLTLRQDASGELCLELEPAKGTRRSYSCRNIEAIYTHPTRPSRVVISLVGEKKLELECVDADKVAVNLREAVFRRCSSE